MKNNKINIWLEAELNRRHKDFQSNALPTELSSHKNYIKKNILYIDWGEKNLGLSITLEYPRIITPIFKLTHNKNFFLILKKSLNIYQINLIYIGRLQKINNSILLKKIKEFSTSLKNFNIPIYKIIEYYTTHTSKNANRIKKKYNIKKKQKNFCDILSTIFMN